MSDTRKDWNTAEIRAFKAAFDQHVKPLSWGEGWLGGARDPLGMYQQAADLLKKRQSDADNSLNSVTAEKSASAPVLVGELQAYEMTLVQQTNDVVQHERPGNDGAQPMIDGKTKLLLGLADRWVEFEARCISVRNQITAGADDAGVRDKLMKRAIDLLGFATELAGTADGLKPAAAAIYREVEQQRLALDGMVCGAGGTGAGITDAERFGRALDGMKAALQECTNKLAALPGSPDDLYKSALKQMYGLDITMPPPAPVVGPVVGPGAPAPKIPYRAFFDALAMVPSDQAINAMLDKIVYTKLDGGGGDYLETEKRIRIDPSLDLKKEEIYTNPETGKPEKVNAFSVTTLHEIGHSVDSAYKIMETHGSKAGCGGWTQKDPFAYVAPAFLLFSTELRRRVPGPGPVATSLAGDKLKPLFVSYMVGHSKAADLKKSWTAMWAQDASDALNAEKHALQQGVMALTKAIEVFFARDDHPPQTVVERYGVFTAADTDLIALLTGSVPPVFLAGALAVAFAAVFGAGPDAPGGASDGSTLKDWLMDRWIDYGGATAGRVMQVDVDAAAWADEAVASLPPGVNLKDYLADGKPWNRNLSEAKIGTEDAAHEAYKGDAKWWRYSADDYKKTKVNDYQWRAPGEWFAELYAITWFKKVEPPAAVGKDVRPYLFGGHVS
jgi:hypothetical protein